MTHYKWSAACLCLTLMTCASDARGSVGSTFLKMLARHATKETGEEAAEKLTKEVGEVVVERVAAKVVKEGGEESLNRVAELAAKHGTDVVRALDNSPSITAVIRALDELPVDDIPKAAARLAAGSQGRELAETTLRYGARALSAEVRHPGVGGHIVKALGGDGASLCEHLTADQAIALGRHVDDIAALPPSQRSQVIDLIATQTDRFFQFVGRFVENNPGKVLFTASTTGVVLAEPERVLGGDEIVFDADGNPRVFSKPGLVGRTASGVGDTFVGPVVRTALWIAAPALAIFAGIKLWGVWRREVRLSAAKRNDCR
jgi:hypothetical protein